MKCRMSVWGINPMVFEYEKRYVYGTDLESSKIFFKLLSKRVRIDGFIDEELKGGRIWNQPVYGIQELDDEKALLILPKGKNIGERKQSVCEDVIISFPKYCGVNVLYIYGAGNVGKLLMNELTKEGIQVKGFIDSDSVKVGKTFCGKEIYGKEIIQNLTANDTIVEAGRFCEEIDAAINEVRDDIKCFYWKYEKEYELWDGNSVVIDSEKGITIPARNIFLISNLPCERKIMLWGTDGELLYKYYEVFQLLGFKDICIVSDSGKDIKGINKFSSIEEVLYESSFWILICEPFTTWHAEKLQKLGLEYGRDYAPIDDSQVIRKVKDKKQILDINLGYTVKMNFKYPGFYMFGDYAEDDYKIVILGGSTSEAHNYWFKSWPEIFYEKYCGKKISILDGAVSGYNSAFELIKLIRDAVYLKPDMLIVYDGVNDINRFENKKTNLYNFMYLRSILYMLSGKEIRGGHLLELKQIGDDVEIWGGIENPNGKVADEWLMNINCMKAIADMHSIKFYSFIQPMLFSKKKPVSLHEASVMRMNEIAWEGNLYQEQCMLFRQEAKKIAEKYEHIYDLSHIFDQDDVYIDDCHVYEYGNTIVAREIYEVVKKYLP